MTESAGAPSLTEFAAGHKLGLTRFAYLLSGDRHAAEDLVQDVLMAIFRRFGDDLPVDEPVAYVRAAVVNAYLSRRRLRSSSERASGLDLREHRTAAGPDLADQDLVWRALARLPRRQRAVLVLRFYADLPDLDIAAVLGCRVGTVSSAISRAIAVLRQDTSLRPDGVLEP